jgi:hypothetical protein
MMKYDYDLDSASPKDTMSAASKHIILNGVALMKPSQGNKALTITFEKELKFEFACTNDHSHFNAQRGKLRKARGRVMSGMGRQERYLWLRKIGSHVGGEEVLFQIDCNVIPIWNIICDSMYLSRTVSLSNFQSVLQSWNYCLCCRNYC